MRFFFLLDKPVGLSGKSLETAICSTDLKTTPLILAGVNCAGVVRSWLWNLKSSISSNF